MNRNRDKKPGDARKLVEMAKDAPEWFLFLWFYIVIKKINQTHIFSFLRAKNVPPSPWTNFFSETLPSIEEVLLFIFSFFDRKNHILTLVSFGFLCLPSFFLAQKLRDPGAVHSHMDEFSGLLSEQLSSMIASGFFLFFLFIKFFF